MDNDRIMNGGGRGATNLAPLVAKRADPSTTWDYFPPITDRSGALASDADGNVWIRTTTLLEDRPVYDVVNRHGEIVDRLQLPAFRSIAGFGPGVIYMAVQDSSKKVHLERARIRWPDAARRITCAVELHLRPKGDVARPASKDPRGYAAAVTQRARR